MTLTAVVCGHPVPKGTLVRGRGRALYYPAPVKVWEAAIRKEVAAQMARDGLPLFGAPCAVALRFYLVPTKGGKAPGRLRGDVDKLARCVLDALTGAAYVDDELVHGLMARKYAVESNGVERVEISVHLESAIRAQTLAALGVAA